MATFLGLGGGGVPVWDSRSVKDPAAGALLVRNGIMGKSLAATLGKRPVRCCGDTATSWWSRHHAHRRQASTRK